VQHATASPEQTLIADKSDPYQSGAMLKRCIAVLALALSAPAAAQTPALPFTLKQIGPGVYAAIDGPEHKAGSNAGFVVGDDGVLVVDALFTPEAATALVGEIRRITPKPIRYVVNTHYHLDHTGGDEVLRDAGAVIIAHKNVRGWVRVNNANLFGERITPEIKARIAAVPLPDVVTDKDLVVWLGARKVVVRKVLGHTGGDLVVAVPDAHVLFAGDMLWRKVAPNLIDGSVREWTATDADFERLPDAAQTRYVPGHGDVADAKDVADFRTYLLDLRRLVAAGRKAGLKDDALVQAVAPKLRALHPDWTISDRAIAAEVKYMSEELAGTKKRPVPVGD
jgi:cyclase